MRPGAENGENRFGTFHKTDISIYLAYINFTYFQNEADLCKRRIKVYKIMIVKIIYK